jgi:hypothetical protein
VNRPRVDAALTFGVSLIVSVVLWYPTLRATMNGNIEITDAGIRYLLALALAWTAVFGVSSLVAMYTSKPRTPSFVPPDEGVRARIPARRSADQLPGPESDDEAPDRNAA